MLAVTKQVHYDMMLQTQNNKLLFLNKNLLSPVIRNYGSDLSVPYKASTSLH